MTATAELMDIDNDFPSCDLDLRDFGGTLRFNGPVRTVAVDADNGLVKAVLSEPGDGAVLVVDAGGSRSSAMVGDLIAAKAVENGWVGIVVNGVIRDSAAIAKIGIGLKALGTNPRRSAKTGAGQRDVAVSFGGVEFEPGTWLYADEDGVILTPAPVLD